MKPKVIAIRQERIFDLNEVGELVKELTALNSNLIVFGLPFSGKSYLIKKICVQSKKFITLEEEEITDEKNGESIKKESKGKKWVVGHQFPIQSESVSDEYLANFLLKELHLNLEKWVILRIRTK